ncbi:MAG: zonular occludens toxin domain-containing protein [Clostridia bacterium]
MITCVFGLPGQGKSTYMAKLARQALTTRRGRKRYDRVYCNFNMAGCYRLNYEDLGKYNFENCLILLDEMMNEADSRDFKKFDAYKKYFFSNHRHYGVDIVYFTQAWDDVDKKIRNNTQELYYIRKVFCWSAVMPIKQILTVDDNSHQIVTGYQLRGLIYAQLFFRPFYYKWFDSFERRQLPPLEDRHNVKYSEIPVSLRSTVFHGLHASLYRFVLSCRIRLGNFLFKLLSKDKDKE